MHYYLFRKNTPYCGTEDYEVVESDTPISVEDMKELRKEMARDHGEKYVYLVEQNFDDEENYDTEEDFQDALQDAIDSYYCDCECFLEDITTDKEKREEWASDYGA